MPISQIGECSEEHWAEVLSIIVDSVTEFGFDANLVSVAEEITIIQRTIVQNLYNLPIVICDVSEKNPNVMFELGLRLAFDKPTIIIKDDITSFSFDTGIVEHIEYPRDLRFSKIMSFKRKLGEKAKATLDRSQSDKEYSTFLRHFGEFKPAAISEQEISGQEYMMQQLSSIEIKLDRITRARIPYKSKPPFPNDAEIDICCRALSENYIKSLKSMVDRDENIVSSRIINVDGHIHLLAECSTKDPYERARIERKFRIKTEKLFHYDPRFGPNLEEEK